VIPLDATALPSQSPHLLALCWQLDALAQQLRARQLPARPQSAPPRLAAVHFIGYSKNSDGLRLNIASLDKKVIYADTHWPSYSPTRSFYLSVTAATPIVAGSGTGSYRGISGSLTMTVTIDEVDKTHMNGPFLSQLIFLVGSGFVSLG
jgi:hypothetical protein